MKSSNEYDFRLVFLPLYRHSKNSGFFRTLAPPLFLRVTACGPLPVFYKGGWRTATRDVQIGAGLVV